MTTVKKTHWFRNTLIVLVTCGIIGVVWAAVNFTAHPERTYATASLQFSFNGAGEGKGPNGYAFSVNGIYADEMIAKALESSELESAYTVDQIRDNLSVTAAYPENIVKQMTAYNSLLDANAEQQAALTDYHPTIFNVRLYNDFDPQIPSAQLTGLLNHLLEAYRAYFAKYNSASLAQTDPIPDLSEYDYAQQLTAISEASAQQQRYAKEMAEKAPDFRQDRKNFDDILVSYEALDADIGRLNATVALNALSKDRERLQKQYEMEIRTLNRNLEGEQEELKQIEKLVSTYDKDDILYVSTSSAVQKVGSNSSATYDKLVTRKKELTDAIAADQASIAKYEALLADMTASDEKTGETSTLETVDNKEDTEEKSSETQAVSSGTESTDAAAAAEMTAEELEVLGNFAERQLKALQTKKDAVTAQFISMLDAYTAQEVNEQTVSVRALKYKTSSFFSDTFALEAIKIAGSLCALGFIACIALLIASRWKEDRKRKA